MFKFWVNVSFKVKASVLVAILVSFTVITGSVYHVLVTKISGLSITQSSDTMMEGYKHELKDVVDMTAATLGAAVEGVSDEKQVHSIFNKLIQNARFLPDKSGYIFIYKKGGTVFVLPPQPEKEGKNLIDFKDPNGKLLIKELDNVADNGGGYVEYVWNKPGRGLVPKLSYARMMPDGRYWIGTGVYLDDIQARKEEILSTTNSLTGSYLSKLYVVLGFAGILLALPLTWVLISSIVKPVGELTEVAEQYSLGKLDLSIPYTERTDEIGKLAKALERLGMSIKAAMARINRS